MTVTGIDINISNQHGRTPLTEAFGSPENEPFVTELLQRPNLIIDPTEATSSGYNILMDAEAMRWTQVEGLQ